MERNLRPQKHSGREGAGLPQGPAGRRGPFKGRLCCAPGPASNIWFSLARPSSCSCPTETFDPGAGGDVSSGRPQAPCLRPEAVGLAVPRGVGWHELRDPGIRAGPGQPQQKSRWPGRVSCRGALQEGSGPDTGSSTGVPSGPGEVSPLPAPVCLSLEPYPYCWPVLVTLPDDAFILLPKDLFTHLRDKS